MNTQKIIQNTIAYFNQQKLYGDELILKDIPSKFQSAAQEEWKTLDDLKRSVHSCNKCSIVSEISGKIIGRGDPESKLMVISDSPTILKNKNNESELLSKILGAISINLTDVYLCSILKCHVPSPRKPEQHVYKNCLPFLRGQIKIIAPRLILILGSGAGNMVLGKDTNIIKLRKANYHKIDNAYIYITYHPAALINKYDPDQRKKKKQVWEDVKSLRRMYDRIQGE